MSKEQAAFTVGEVVQLKSGGPKMTVAAIYPTGVISVVWANSVGSIAKGEIGYQLLKRTK